MPIRLYPFTTHKNLLGSIEQSISISNVQSCSWV